MGLDVEAGPPVALDEAMELPGAITEVPSGWVNAVDCCEHKPPPT